MGQNTATPATLAALAADWATAWPSAAVSASPPSLANSQVNSRAVSIWEITTWILPMAAEHLRRVLRQTPALPQGMTGNQTGGQTGKSAGPASRADSRTASRTDSATRWFSLAEVASLRRHFAATGAAHKAYVPARPVGASAPLIALTGPLGNTGRTTTTLHLACAAALAGYKVLVIDADPGGRLAHSLGATVGTGAGPGAAQGDTFLPLIARAFGLHLRQINAGRLDRGETPLAVDDSIATALAMDPARLPRPSAWPGLDVIAAHPDLGLADLQIAAWQSTARSWDVGQAVAQAVEGAGLRQRYDLIFCDMGRGLGPLNMALLTAADLLLIPVITGGRTLVRTGAPGPDLTSLAHASLARALQMQEAAATMTARALGQAARPLGWRRLMTLQIGAASVSASGALQGTTLLPHPLPVIPQISTTGPTHFYDLDYRNVGRLTYAPLRDACDAAWRGLAAVLAELWAEDAAKTESVMGK